MPVVVWERFHLKCTSHGEVLLITFDSGLSGSILTSLCRFSDLSKGDIDHLTASRPLQGDGARRSNPRTASLCAKVRVDVDNIILVLHHAGVKDRRGTRALWRRSPSSFFCDRVGVDVIIRPYRLSSVGLTLGVGTPANQGGWGPFSVSVILF